MMNFAFEEHAQNGHGVNRPAQSQASSFVVWRRAAVPFALLVRRTDDACEGDHEDSSRGVAQRRSQAHQQVAHRAQRHERLSSEDCQLHHVWRPQGNRHAQALCGIGVERLPGAVTEGSGSRGRIDVEFPVTEEEQQFLSGV